MVSIVIVDDHLGAGAFSNVFKGTMCEDQCTAVKIFKEKKITKRDE